MKTVSGKEKKNANFMDFTSSGLWFFFSSNISYLITKVFFQFYNVKTYMYFLSPPCKNVKNLIGY